MKSMTGFGKVAYECPFGTIQIELKSTNNRFANFSFRAPRIFDPYEFSIINYLKPRILRGSVTVNFKFTPNDKTSIIDLRVDKALAKQYYENVNELKEDFNLSGELYPNFFLSCHNVFYTKEKELPEISEHIFKALDQCLETFDSFRVDEGKNLKAQLVECSANIRSSLDSLMAEKDNITDYYIAHLREKMDKFAKKYGEIPEERILQEALIFADKSDISEEIIRLNSHLDALADVIEKDKSIGKKLDFIAQECLREANTIGSKANTNQISHVAIDLKCEIERIREQVQNIE